MPLLRHLPAALACLLLVGPPAAATDPASESSEETGSAEEESPDTSNEPPSPATDAAPEPPPPKPLSNTIRWSTATEVDNFGFDVFRSTKEEGPFERLNPEAIQGAGTTDEPQKYQWVDDTIDPHTAYFYYVESISMTGEREQFTPIGKASAKVPSEAAPEPDTAVTEPGDTDDPSDGAGGEDAGSGGGAEVTDAADDGSGS